VSNTDVQIRSVLEAHGRLAADVEKLSDNDDLYNKGLTSHASVNVMLALENEFGLEFPDALLHRGTFESLGSIRTALGSLGVDIS
jgi:acyl carrier protein